MTNRLFRAIGLATFALGLASAAPGSAAAQISQKPQPPAANLSGNWTMTIAMGSHPVEAAVAIKQDGTTLTGTMTTEHLGEMTLVGTVDERDGSHDVDG